MITHCLTRFLPEQDNQRLVNTMLSPKHHVQTEPGTKIKLIGKNVQLINKTHTSFSIMIESVYLTNRFQVAVRLFSNRSIFDDDVIYTSVLQ